MDANVNYSINFINMIYGNVVILFYRGEKEIRRFRRELRVYPCLPSGRSASPFLCGEKQ
jgi:hypothetical protein